MAINEYLIADLARSYHVLNTYQELFNHVKYALGGREIGVQSKFELHAIVSELICNYYSGECTLKAKLVDCFIKKDVVAAFEMSVNNSRVDFLTVNGDTRSYEIKSSLDNLTKLSKQVSDYEKVFDYNYVVINEKHLAGVEKLIPKHYGILINQEGNLFEYKSSKLNNNLDSFVQLSLLTKKELSSYFTRKDISAEEILVNFEPEEINDLFKAILKKRYTRKWEFVRSHASSIMPVDYQFFFNHNIQPQIIYS